MDCWPLVWVDHSAFDRCHCGSFTLEVGKAQAIYGRWFVYCRSVFASAGVDDGNCQPIRERCREGVSILFRAGFWHLRLCRSLYQAKNVTIALAVLSIYAVDFAINIGELVDALIWIILTSFSSGLLSQLDR